MSVFCVQKEEKGRRKEQAKRGKRRTVGEWGEREGRCREGDERAGPGLKPPPVLRPCSVHVASSRAAIRRVQCLHQRLKHRCLCGVLSMCVRGLGRGG